MFINKKYNQFSYIMLYFNIQFLQYFFIGIYKLFNKVYANKTTKI
jgi:hypothetical protein